MRTTTQTREAGRDSPAQGRVWQPPIRSAPVAPPSTTPPTPTAFASPHRPRRAHRAGARTTRLGARGASPAAASPQHRPRRGQGGRLPIAAKPVNVPDRWVWRPGDPHSLTASRRVWSSCPVTVDLGRHRIEAVPRRNSPGNVAEKRSEAGGAHLKTRRRQRLEEVPHRVGQRLIYRIVGQYHVVVQAVLM